MSTRAPVTEQCNFVTTSLQHSSALEIIKLFRQVDSQLFYGHSTFESIMDEKMLKKICQLSDSFRDAKKNNHKVVFSGCGTSGRLAYICAHNYNSDSDAPVFEYVIAGGDKALVKSEELAEDKPDYGRKDLEPFVTKGEKFVFVGISCGISAPYVAGQLDYCPKNADPYLIGFNPLELTRKTKVPTWEKSFGEFCQQGKFTVINPVVGPEAITGSSRLKGGSMTKIILDTCYVLSKRFESTLDVAKRILMEFMNVSLYTYSHASEIAVLIDLATKSHRVIYTSNSMEAGMFGFLDASECPPTFGCDFEDFRGFIKNGWKGFKNRDGDLSHLGKQYQIDNYEKSDGDLVIQIDIQDGNHVILKSEHQSMSIKLDFVSKDVQALAAQFSLKIVLNLISSGAFISRDMVFENRMINLRVSNRKLYERAIGIIEYVTKTDKKRAEDLLLLSIWRDEIPGDMEQSIVKAQKMNHVVPVAVRLNTMDLIQALQEVNKHIK